MRTYQHCHRVTTGEALCFMQRPLNYDTSKSWGSTVSRLNQFAQSSVLRLDGYLTLMQIRYQSLLFWDSRSHRNFKDWPQRHETSRLRNHLNWTAPFFLGRFSRSHSNEFMFACSALLCVGKFHTVLRYQRRTFVDSIFLEHSRSTNTIAFGSGKLRTDMDSADFIEFVDDIRFPFTISVDSQKKLFRLMKRSKHNSTYDWDAPQPSALQPRGIFSILLSRSRLFKNKVYQLRLRSSSSFLFSFNCVSISKHASRFCLLLIFILSILSPDESSGGKETLELTSYCIARQ